VTRDKWAGGRVTGNTHIASGNGRAIARGYRDLLVWQKGISLVKEVYELTKGFPDEERFGLVSQLRRAALSIPSNIAEGQARHTTREFILFISHAEGSLAELDTQMARRYRHQPNGVQIP
jgi:four helix bundle protein